MKQIITLLLIFCAALSASAKGNNKRVVFTTTPQMHCESCEQKITGNLRFVKGVKIIQTNIAQQTVTITFDSTKCSTKDLVKAFKKIKYTVKEVDPNSLPSCCSEDTTADHSACEDKKKK